MVAEKPSHFPPSTARFLLFFLRVKSKAAGGETQLRRDLPKWSSETAITRGALVSKRDEFWETAPMFEGRKVNIASL